MGYLLFIYIKHPSYFLEQLSDRDIMGSIEQVKSELFEFKDDARGESNAKFMKAFPGGYGEGDIFIGITVPNMRAVAKKFVKELALKEVELLLHESIHEYRLTALFMMVYKFEKEKGELERQRIVDLYLANLQYVNNWDLVDSSSYKILGAYLIDKDKTLLYKFSKSDNMWIQRISIISTLFFIKKDMYEPTLIIAETLLNHEHDLIHKAVGWMLREVGKRNYEVEFDFLKRHYQSMPRTMLRYSIEKFDEDIRLDFLKGKI